MCVVCHKSEKTADCVTVSFLPAPGAVRKCDQDQHTDVLSGKTPRSRFVQKTSYTKSSSILLSKGVVLISCQLGEGLM